MRLTTGGCAETLAAVGRPQGHVPWESEVRRGAFRTAPQSPPLDALSCPVTPHAAYDELVRLSRERAVLASCLELLGWDELTYMPHGGVEHRGRQTASIAGLLHRSLTDRRLVDLLDAAGAHPEASEPRSPVAVNLREWRRTVERESRLPLSLVEELASVTTTGQQAWADARQNDDFQQFLPWLERIVALKQAKARCLLPDGVLYDALLEDYEPGVTTAELCVAFSELRAELVRLLDAVRGSRRKIRTAMLRRAYPLDRQRLLVESVAADVGFDFARGRIDTTSHPFFSPVGPGDCRIATRFHHTDFNEGFFATLHEVGHALYEQGLDPDHYGTPYGEAPSMGLHESQSRFWENCVGRSRPFWEHFFPRVRETFHDVLHDVRIGDFHKAVNQVQPGWCRVRADAATYDMHILARFELERALISGELAPRDLPSAWNDEYRTLLGVVPSGDAEGCLQDGHWSAGQFGYFPTYTLGNLYAAQIHQKVRSELPELDMQIAKGEFEPLLEWLTKKLFRAGRRHSAAETLLDVTGSAPDVRPLAEQLWQRCAELYGLRAAGG